MKFSAQEEYGLRCLVTLGREGPGGFLTIPQISKREGLSSSHVAKLLSILRKAGFVSSTRGQAGGYMLAREPEKMLVGGILECLGGRLFSTEFCDRHTGVMPECVHESECVLRPVWTRVQAAVDVALEGMTLGDILNGTDSSRPIMFYETDRRHAAPV